MTTPQGPLVGEVVSTLDPLQRGRVQVRFAGLGEDPLWCDPVLPATSGDPGRVRAVPPVGSTVLVLWENNDLDDRPHWVGTTSSEQPGDPPGGTLLIRTPAGVEVRLAVDGSCVRITSSAGPTVVLDGATVTVSNGLGAHLSLDGPVVDVNHGALVVT